MKKTLGPRIKGIFTFQCWKLHFPVPQGVKET